ncbi:hypothetical protein [Azospirillum baldaniorum]|nr:hypothetical protein [Azospirillum baldaniorum]
MGGVAFLASSFGGHRIRFAPDMEGGGAPDAGGGAEPLSLGDAVALFRDTKTTTETQEPAADGAAPDKIPAEDAGQAPEGDDSAQRQEEQDEPDTSPAIEPPPTLDAKLRAKWASLDRETQQDFAQWEAAKQEGVQAKLREAAETRKAGEAERKAAEQERKQAAQFQQVLDMAVAELGSQLQQEPDWAKLATDDPLGYIQQRAAWDEKVAKFQQLHAEQQRQAAQQQAEQTERVKAYVADQSQRLLDAIPEWKADPTKAKAEQAEIRSFLEKSGFSKEEIGQLYDHRIGVMARKAALYDRAQAGLKAKPAAAPGKPVPPGTALTKGEAQAVSRDALIKRVERTGNISDAVALLRANRRR